MINTLKTLCALSGVSSFEDEVRDYIRQRVTPYATDLRVDAMGNLIVLKKGARATGNKLMLCAHMDEVGLIIKSITEDGYLKFGCVGGIDRRVLLGKQVALGEQKVTGVIGLKAIHMTTAEERKKVPKLEEYYIDIGVKSREEAEKLVALAVPIPGLQYITQTLGAVDPGFLSLHFLGFCSRPGRCSARFFCPRW